MKILISLFMAALPASVCAQALSPTLAAVGHISAAAGSNPDIAAARADSGKPYSGVSAGSYGARAADADVPSANPPARVETGSHNAAPTGYHHTQPAPSAPAPAHHNPPPSSHPAPGHNNPPPPQTGPSHPGPGHPGHGHHDHHPGTGWAALNIFSALVNLFSMDGNLTTGAVVAAVVITVVLVAVLI